MPSSLNEGPKPHRVTVGRAGMQKDGYVEIDKYAVLKLVPRAAPTSGAVGDVYNNLATGKVMLCTVAGTPGTWVVLGTQA